MELMSTSISILIFFLSAFVLYFYSKKQKQIAKLPPGTMGWPYIGETLQLYSQDPNKFFAEKEKRYGEIFKTRILGCPCVMLASPEAARLVLVSQAHLFKPTYPKSKEKMIGSCALFFHQGDYHTHIRKLVQSSFSPDSIRKLIPGIEAIAISSLDSWANEKVINTFQEMKKFSFKVGILSLFGHLDGKIVEDLMQNYCTLEKGYNSFVNRLPGSAYSRAISARKRLSQIIHEVICERKEKGLLQNDLLGQLLNFKDGKGKALTEDQISDNILGVLFAAQDTTASTLTWILKYLYDDQKLLEAVKVEQKAIYESNDGGIKALTWAQTRNMPLASRVILESLRTASIISFTFREALVDVEYKGFLIPKGWKVMPLFRNIHHNPEFFPDPKRFDPSRFEVAPKPNTFMPFGNGLHACPGNELAKVEILILLHHLLANFRWKVVGSQTGFEYRPFLIPRHGLPATLSRESKTDEVCI